MKCAADLDGPFGIGQRRLQPVSLVPVLPCLLLGLLDFATQLGKRALQRRLLGLEFLSELNLPNEKKGERDSKQIVAITEPLEQRSRI